MKMPRPRFLCSGISGAWALIALAGLLTTLLRPSAPPRVTLTAATSITSPIANLGNAAQETGIPLLNGDYLSFDKDDNPLIAAIKTSMAWHNYSPGRNVAAIALLRNSESRIIVAQSAGSLARPDRNVFIDEYDYANGKLLQASVHNEYLGNQEANGGNFHAETNDINYIKSKSLLTKFHPNKVIVDSLLDFCPVCDLRLHFALDGLHTTFLRNFPKRTRRFYAIVNNKNLSTQEKLDQLHKLAVGQMRRAIQAWRKTGMLINGKDPGVTSQVSRLVDNKALAAHEMLFGCPGDSSMGMSGGNGGSAMELAAFSSSDPCGGEGEGAPGGLVKALTSGNLGGVDFSTLQMRYMSDNPDSTGLQYSFSGQKYTSANPQDIGSALNVLTGNAADLRTWLVLNPDEFWVNLNPSEPDRIIGAQLGQTNAGRELLDADFQLKRSSARLMNPNTTLGAQYWRDLAGTSPSVCYGSRMWIVPGQVQVREDGGSLYILKAQLAVKAVPDHVADMPATCHYNAQTDARGQRLDQTMIVPLITKMVNTAPAYAPIRRAFMARIVAQWIRDRHANGEHTSFDHLINSGNIGPAKLRGGWTPQQVYDTYLKSLKDGEFTYTTTIHQDGATYLQKITVGGVDFTHLNPAMISAAQMNQDYPQLPQTAKSSVTQITSSGGSLWLGDTIAPATGSIRSNPGDLIRFLTSGRTGILILVLAALAVVIFGINRRSRRGRQIT